ncbi:MAG TPA: helix-turn-helix domain-containing protein [Lacunisphaera sp.]|nr:helix-turn-helix domain-containing protein [Lacunisphaera sp.]
MKPGTLEAHDPRLVRLLEYMRAHLDEPLDLDALARLAGVSPRQLDRVFLRLFGESPRACLRRLRLERAAGQLRTSRRRILAIALDAGFESHEAFTRSFTRRFGHKPADYRRLPRATLQPRDRGEYWRLALAGGLRRHVEHDGR